MLELPPVDRPREKLKSRGARALSDRELVALLIGTGVKGYDALAVAGKALTLMDSACEAGPGLDDLTSINGIGEVRALQILAALEFARRRIKPEGIKISFPHDIVPLILHYSDRKQEHFFSLTLSGAHEIIALRVVTIGLVDKTHVHPREVFADAITDRACALIVAHNHPSGVTAPSREDREVTSQLKSAGEMLGIPLLDHIIFSRRGYFSFQEEGAL
jgi:DNA repair protein RadC